MKKVINISVIVGVLFAGYVYYQYHVEYIKLFDLATENFDNNFSSDEAPSKQLQKLYGLSTVAFLIAILLIFSLLVKDLLVNVNGLLTSRIEDIIIPKQHEKIEKSETLHQEEILSHVEETAPILHEYLNRIETKISDNIDDSILRCLVDFFDASLGILYIPADNKKLLAKVTFGCAWETEEEKIFSFEGLVGQAIKEKKSLIISSIPSGYIKIVSGLGDSEPKSLLITPIFDNDKLLAVIELASFAVFTQSSVNKIEQTKTTLIKLLRRENR